MAMPAFPGNDSTSDSNGFRADLRRVVRIRFNKDRVTQFSYVNLPPGIKQFGSALRQATRRHEHLPGLALTNPQALRAALQKAGKTKKGQADDAVRWLYNVGVFIEAELANEETAILFDAERLERIAGGETFHDRFERELRQRAQALAEERLKALSTETSPRSGERHATTAPLAEDAVVVLMDHVQEIPHTDIEDAVYQPVQIIESELSIPRSEARALLAQAMEQGLLYSVGTSGAWAVFADSADEPAAELARVLAARQGELERAQHLLAEDTVQCDRDAEDTLNGHQRSWDVRISERIEEIRTRYGGFREQTQQEILAERDRQFEIARREYERRVQEIAAEAHKRLERRLSDVTSDRDREIKTAERQLAERRTDAEALLRVELQTQAEERQRPLIEQVMRFNRELEELRRI